MNNNIEKIKTICIPIEIIHETERFSRERGSGGFEAKVYWIGRFVSETKAEVTRIFIPKQIPRKSFFGVSVEVPEEGNIELISSLKDNEIALIKLHTHPAEAYLSSTDICNPFFRHEGAVSIVIPYFCRGNLQNFKNCCVNIFQSGKWKRMNNSDLDNMFVVKE